MLFRIISLLTLRHVSDRILLGGHDVIMFRKKSSALSPFILKLLFTKFQLICYVLNKYETYNDLYLQLFNLYLFAIIEEDCRSVDTWIGHHYVILNFSTLF